MARAFLGLGSNLGNRVGYLRQAVASLPDLVATSPVYETDPLGGPGHQGAFLNLVVELDTALEPLDVDVLWVDGRTVADPDLEVPHPRMWERRFVLVPLADLASDVATPERLAAAHGEVRRLGDLEALPDDTAEVEG